MDLFMLRSTDFPPGSSTKAFTRVAPELSGVPDPAAVPLGSPSGIYNAEILFLMKKQRICWSGRA
jgi:hypothetical protein